MQRNFFPDLDSHLKTGYEDEDAATIATTRAGRLRTKHRSTANSVPHTLIGSPAGSRSLTPSASVKFKRLVLSEGFDTLNEYGEYREEGVDDDEEDYVRIIDSVEDDEDEEYVPYTTRTTPRAPVSALSTQSSSSSEDESEYSETEAAAAVVLPPQVSDNIYGGPTQPLKRDVSHDLQVKVAAGATGQ